jgi:hypothetical protein
MVVGNGEGYWGEYGELGKKRNEFAKKKQIIVRAKSTSVIITHRGVILIVSPKNPSA